MWKTVYDVLEDNRMAVAASDKTEGRITTEYVQGQSQLFLLSTMSTRYRYVIRLSAAEKGVTRLNIIAYLESSGKQLPSWRDISNENKALISNLENWLYEQIQKRIKA
jgi:hypothetical protein